MSSFETLSHEKPEMSQLEPLHDERSVPGRIDFSHVLLLL